MDIKFAYLWKLILDIFGNFAIIMGIINAFENMNYYIHIIWIFHIDTSAMHGLMWINFLHICI